MAASSASTDGPPLLAIADIEPEDVPAVETGPPAKDPTPMMEHYPHVCFDKYPDGREVVTWLEFNIYLRNGVQTICRSDGNMTGCISLVQWMRSYHEVEVVITSASLASTQI